MMNSWITKTAISLILRVGHHFKVNLKLIFSLLFFDPRFLTQYCIDQFDTLEACL